MKNNLGCMAERFKSLLNRFFNTLLEFTISGYKMLKFTNTVLKEGFTLITKSIKESLVFED